MIKRGLALLLCFGFSFACSLGFAQQAPATPDPVAQALFPPELIMQNQKAIGLDDTQKAYVRAEIVKAQGRFTELQWQLQDGMETLTSLLNQDPINETQVLAQLDKVLNSEREVKRVQVTLLVRLKNKLTPDQQQRLRALRNKPAGE